MKSFVYKNIKKELLNDAGYFKPSEGWNPLVDNIYYKENLKNIKIQKFIIFPVHLDIFMMVI